MGVSSSVLHFNTQTSRLLVCTVAGNQPAVHTCTVTTTSEGPGHAFTDESLPSSLSLIPYSRHANPRSCGKQARRRWIGGQCEQVCACRQALPEDCNQRRFEGKAAAVWGYRGGGVGGIDCLSTCAIYLLLQNAISMAQIVKMVFNVWDKHFYLGIIMKYCFINWTHYSKIASSAVISYNFMLNTYTYIRYLIFECLVFLGYST